MLPPEHHALDELYGNTDLAEMTQKTNDTNVNSSVWQPRKPRPKPGSPDPQFREYFS